MIVFRDSDHLRLRDRLASARRKGSQFFVWFLAGFISAGDRPGRRDPQPERDTTIRAASAPTAARLLPISAQVCLRCGEDLDYPDRDSGAEGGAQPACKLPIPSGSRTRGDCLYSVTYACCGWLDSGRRDAVHFDTRPASSADCRRGRTLKGVTRAHHAVQR